MIQFNTYSPKKAEVEAVRLTRENLEAVKEFLEGKGFYTLIFDFGHRIAIRSSVGTVEIGIGDYLAVENGCCSIFTKEIFEANYYV